MKSNQEVFVQKYSLLNTEQKEAVDSLDGPVLVVAGPGTGKTQLLSTRVANILDKTDTLAKSILCLTFTDNAAFNMRERLSTIIGQEAYKVNIHTFHSLAVEIINNNPEYFFVGVDYKPTDQTNQIQILQNIFTKLPLNNPLASYSPEYGFTFLSDTLSVIGNLKKNGVNPEEFLEIVEDNKFIGEILSPLFQNVASKRVNKNVALEWLEVLDIATQEMLKRLEKVNKKPIYTITQPLARILLDKILEVKNSFLETEKTSVLSEFKKKNFVKTKLDLYLLKELSDYSKMKALGDIYVEYQKELKKNKLYDFEDMIMEVNTALQNPEKPELRYLYQEKYLYILVDEFQDTNDAQLKLIHNLIDFDIWEGKPNLLVVGDDDQSIFKFQGAKHTNIFKFQELFTDTKIIQLKRNYRSEEDILEFATKIISQADERSGNLLGFEKILISGKS